eukprot:354175-Chlamydomonas_euryale.AAC.4
MRRQGIDAQDVGQKSSARKSALMSGRARHHIPARHHTHPSPHVRAPHFSHLLAARVSSLPSFVVPAKRSSHGFCDALRDGEYDSLTCRRALCIALDPEEGEGGGRDREERAGWGVEQ